MPNPFEDATVPLELRVACSDAALACAAAWINRVAAERRLNDDRDRTGRYQPALAAAANTAFGEHSEAADKLRGLVNDIANRIP